MKKIVIILSSLVLIVVSFVFLTKSTQQQMESKQIVATSNYAIYDILNHVASKDMEVVNILPYGVDPHSFEPTPKTFAKLEKSSLFFFSGAVLDPWVEHLSKNLHSVDMSRFVHLRELDEDEEHEEQHHHHHHHGAYDPHYWLDLQNMQLMTQAIADALKKIDPKNSTVIEANAKSYIQKLQDLDKEYAKALRSCQKDTIVVTHNAFGYLADKFHFHVSSLTGMTSDAQASPNDVIALFKRVKEQGISTVFGEDFGNKKEMQSFAHDLNISLQNLRPLGNITADDAVKGLDYAKAMQLNLKKIAEALECR